MVFIVLPIVGSGNSSSKRKKPVQPVMAQSQNTTTGQLIDDSERMAVRGQAEESITIGETINDPRHTYVDDDPSQFIPIEQAYLASEPTTKQINENLKSLNQSLRKKQVELEEARNIAFRNRNSFNLLTIVEKIKDEIKSIEDDIEDLKLQKVNFSTGGSLQDEINELRGYENQLRQSIQQINQAISSSVAHGGMNPEGIILIEQQNMISEQILKLRKHIRKIEQQLNSPEP